MSKSSKRKRRSLSFFFAILFFYIICTFLFSISTSPLYPNTYGFDAAIFSLVGRGIVAGKQLYIDLFDHKGPIIFAINALGSILGGRTGIFFVQLMAGTITLLFLYLTVEQFFSVVETKSFMRCLFVFVCSYASFFFVFEGGNLTEEYSLPLISGSVYLFTRYAKNVKNEERHNPWYAFYHGAAIAFISMLRLNNALTICVGVLVIILYLIVKKEYKNLLQNILFGCLGVAVVLCPILLVLKSRGSLDDMLYATFFHNFTIAKETAHIPISVKSFKNIALYLPILISAGLCALSIFRKKTMDLFDIIMGAVILSNLIELLCINRYVHYFTIFFPVYCISLAAFFPSDKKILPVLLICFCTLLNFGYTFFRSNNEIQDIYVSKKRQVEYQEVLSNLNLIPENEKASVIGYRIHCKYYLYGDIIPCFKYYTNQDQWAITNPAILEDFMAFVSEEGPKWVMINADETNQTLLNILQEKYELKMKDPFIQYYSLSRD